MVRPVSESLGPTGRIERVSAGAMVVVAAHGELDLQSVAPLRSAVDAALGERPLILALDLRDVTFVDCGIVGELVATEQRCEAHGRRLMLVRGGTQVDRVLEACALEGHFHLVSALDEIPGGEPTGSAASEND